jgi:tRNA dimethylallyltransferase
MNMGSSNLPRVALIAGPTASGKSALAMVLAKAHHGTIINADSAQVYRDLRLISARPDREEEAEIPHLLYGYRDGAVACSAAEWAADARSAIDAACSSGRLPILVGGTGLYLRTLLDGIAPVPEIDPAVRARVRAMPVDEAYALLRSTDAQGAERLRPTDKTRVARALEVMFSTGRPLSQWQQNPQGGIKDAVQLVPLVLLPPRDWLHQRCDLRFERMMSEGGVDEVRRLLDRHLNPALPVMRAIGVREIAAMLEGRMTREEALTMGKAATRQYAKRQYTWFRRQPPAGWTRFELALDSAAATRVALQMVSS